MQPMVQSESVRMLSFLATLDTCTSRAKRYDSGVASTATLEHPYNSLCFPGDARWSEIATEFRAMMVQLESRTSFPIARQSNTTRKACDTFAFFYSLLHAGVQQKGFALWVGPHTTRLASARRATTCKTGQYGSPIRETDTSFFDDDRLYDGNFACANGVC